MVLKPKPSKSKMTKPASQRTKVFRSGNSQAVRLPKDFRVEVDEVELFRQGEDIILRKKPSNLLSAFQALAAVEGTIQREQARMQERDFAALDKR
jgi:antitoxin VapB